MKIKSLGLKRFVYLVINITYYARILYIMQEIAFTYNERRQNFVSLCCSVAFSVAAKKSDCCIRM